MASMPRPSQDRLEWEETRFDLLVPQWTRDVSITAIESVCCQQLTIPPEDPCTVSKQHSGERRRRNHGRSGLGMRLGTTLLDVDQGSQIP